MSYTIKNSILTFNDNFNDPLIKYNKILSDSKIDTIIFNEYFNQEIEHFIPNNIKIIEFPKYSAFRKEVNFLPETIEQIYFGFAKNHTLEELKNLPKSLKKLKLGNQFNQNIIENILPPNLTHLILGDNFNQEITKNTFHLPKSLTDLTFGWYFNQKITENSLPPNLLNLCFDDVYFNQEIKKNVLPESLTYLKLSLNFNRLITKTILPKNLQVIKINKTYKDIIFNQINLNNVKFKTEYYM